MKRLLLTAALITTLSGCSTIMNDRMTDVRVTSEPSGQHFSITDEDGQRVATGVTPAKVNLDAAAGFFDGQTYQVAESTIRPDRGTRLARHRLVLGRLLYQRGVGPDGRLCNRRYVFTS